MKNPFAHTRFVKSAMHAKECVPDSGAELAFIGRSNAGKSSAINAICKQKIAKTSKTPGRTQTINFFAVSTEKRLVDLPGYGYSNVDKKTRKQWGAILNDYFSNRRSIRCVFLIADIRHALVKLDIEVIDWILGIRPDLPLYILLTKSDKLSQSVCTQTLRDTINQLDRIAHDAIGVQTFSARKAQGVDEARYKISSYLML